jgi:hypothetical protein
MYSENVSSAENQQERLQNVSGYISGFVDGEGSFNVSLRRNANYKIGWQIVLSFNVSQKDITMLNLIKDTLQCGIIKRRRCDGLYSYDVTNPSDIVAKVLPFFDSNKFISKTKIFNYELFKEISFIASHKPLLYDDFVKILDLRKMLNMGAGRKRKYTKQNVLEESSETIRQACSDRMI